MSSKEDNDSTTTTNSLGCDRMVNDFRALFFTRVLTTSHFSIEKYFFFFFKTKSLVSKIDVDDDDAPNNQQSQTTTITTNRSI